jgi:hypothetical protein
MNAAHVTTEEATNTRKGLTGDFVDFAIALDPMVSGEAMTELVSATLSDRSAVRAITLRRLLRIHDVCAGAVRHRLIRMCHDGRESHSCGECKSQGEN